MALSRPKRAAVREALLADRASRQASPDVTKIHENNHIREDIKESSAESLEHSVGCPKYKAFSKSKCQLRSPSRPPKNLHPKPWGARDPKEIPCTCFTMRKSLKSAPASMHTSPTREIRKSAPRRTRSPRYPLMPEGPEDVGEVMKLFDEFCDVAERMGVKLSASKLDLMFNKLRNKLSSHQPTPTAAAKTKTQTRTGKRRTSSADSSRPVPEDRNIFDKKALPEAPLDHRSQSNQSQQPTMSQRTSSSTVRGKLEANNVVLELTGPDFQEQTLPGAFTNIFGSMLPSDRYTNFVALGGNQFFGPGEVLPPGIPTTTIVTIDSTEAYMPIHSSDVVVPSRSPRSVIRRRRP